MRGGVGGLVGGWGVLWGGGFPGGWRIDGIRYMLMGMMGVSVCRINVGFVVKCRELSSISRCVCRLCVRGICSREAKVLVFARSGEWAWFEWVGKRFR